MSSCEVAWTSTDSAHVVRLAATRSDAVFSTAATAGWVETDGPVSKLPMDVASWSRRCGAPNPAAAHLQPPP